MAKTVLIESRAVYDFSISFKVMAFNLFLKETIYSCDHSEQRNQNYFRE